MPFLGTKLWWHKIIAGYIEKCVGYRRTFAILFGVCNCLLLVEWQLLVLDPVDQYKENIGTQAHGKYVDGCVDVPTKPLGELLEHDDRRIARADEEHIHISLKAELNNAVQNKGNSAQCDKGQRGHLIVLLGVSSSLREAQEKPYKDQ